MSSAATAKKKRAPRLPNGLTICTGRSWPSGAWYCSAIINNQRIHRMFYDYTKKEAVAKFKNDLRRELGLLK